MDSTELKKQIITQAATAKLASRKVQTLTSDQKNQVLIAMAEDITAAKDDIVFHNEIDVDAAKEAGLNKALVDRLVLNENRIQAMAQGLRDIVSQKDPAVRR